MKKSTRQLPRVEGKCEIASSTDALDAILDNAVEVVRLASFVSGKFDWHLSAYDFRDANVFAAKTLLTAAVSKFWKRVGELGFSNDDFSSTEKNLDPSWNKILHDQMKPIKVSPHMTLFGRRKQLAKFHFKWVKEDEYVGHFTFRGHPTLKDVVDHLLLMTGCSGRIFIGTKDPVPMDNRVYMPMMDYSPYQQYIPKGIYVHSVSTKINAGQVDVFIRICPKPRSRGKKS